MRLGRQAHQHLCGSPVPPLPPPVRQKGGHKAATVHTLIVIIWHVLAETTSYHDLGPDYFTRRIDNPEARQRRLICELEALGHKVSIEPNAAGTCLVTTVSS